MNDKNMKVNIGLSSLVLVLIVLSLVMLSLLSITSARRDMALARRKANATIEYYSATTEGNEFIADVYNKINEYPQKDMKSLFGEYYDDSTNKISTDVNMENGLALRVEMSISDNKQAVNIDTFKVYKKEDYDIDQSRPVWTGAN